MGMPSVVIAFKEKSATAIKRGDRGIVALILKDTVPAINPIEVETVTEIPQSLKAENQKQIELALMGYISPPKKVLVYVIPADAENYTEAQEALEALVWQYVAVPEIGETEVSAFASWIKSLRDTKDLKVKAVLPNSAADHEGIINFTTASMKDAEKEYTAKDYCARMAGMIAGTPLTISTTYAPLSELVDCTKLKRSEMDTAVDKGEFFVFHDGEKVKTARAVNSLVTTTEDKGASFQKIKIVEAMDMIYDDIKKTAEDSYLGKYANSYDNKCLLISAIQAYLDQLEMDGILNNMHDNRVEINVEQQRIYLKGKGIDTEGMTDQQIKEADTGAYVFLAASLKILDAIEDIQINVAI